MNAFVSALEMPIPLDSSNAFCGGRIDATRLFYEAGPGENIKYVDFTSLYPYVNQYGKYPVGHPTIITESFRDINEYEGLVKCKVYFLRESCIIMSFPIRPPDVSSMFKV